MNAVFLVAGQVIERVLDVRQVDTMGKRVPLAQTTKVGSAWSFETVVTQDEFTSCLRHASDFMPTAAHRNPAAAWQLEVYAEELMSTRQSLRFSAKEQMSLEREQS